jgi:cytoskeleton protein RodZ
LAMPSLGLQLRLERERQKLDLSLIAEETRINLSYLEAIEADDLSALPGEFFYRSFVRQYSKYLGIPAAEADKMFESSSALQAAAPDSAAPAPTFGIYASKAEEDRSIKALAESLKDKPLRPPQDDGMSRNWLVFAALIIVGCAAYFAWRNFSPAIPALPSLSQAQQSKPVEAAPVTPAPVTPAPVTTAPTEPAKTETTPTGTAPTQTAVAPPVTSAPPTPPSPTPPSPTPPSPTPPSASTAATSGKGPVSVTVIAKELTWIRITADGQKVFGGTIDPGQQRTVQGRDLEVIVGNAGTLDVIYQGKPLSFGTKGQVKTLLFSPEGWKIKPKPVADPNAPANNTPATNTPATKPPAANPQASIGL